MANLSPRAALIETLERVAADYDLRDQIHGLEPWVADAVAAALTALRETPAGAAHYCPICEHPFDQCNHCANKQAEAGETPADPPTLVEVVWEWRRLTAEYEANWPDEVDSDEERADWRAACDALERVRVYPLIAPVAAPPPAAPAPEGPPDSLTMADAPNRHPWLKGGPYGGLSNTAMPIPATAPAVPSPEMIVSGPGNIAQVIEALAASWLHRHTGAAGMTDDAELIARLRQMADSASPLQDALNLVGEGRHPLTVVELWRQAADALEQRTRTITAQAARADKWQKESHDLMHCLEIEQAELAAATARLRTVEAETWAQAATDVATKLRIGDDGSRMLLYQEFHRRAKAAREGTAPVVKPYSSGGCLDHD